MIEPYYSDDYVTIYHGDCFDLIDSLTFGLIVTDPPYGINLDTANAARGRGTGGSIGRWVAANDYPPIHGDNQPFDPQPWLEFNVPTVLFGANHYASRLPDASHWLVWDKVDGLRSKRLVGFNDNADVELAWTNLPGPARLFSHRWSGAMKTGRDAQTRRRHPTEKPIELMLWVVVQCPEGVILDPYMGSGSTLVAAKEHNRRAIGIEIEERYCEIAAKRCAQEVLPLFDTEPQNSR